ncbi:MAG TPA: helix-turn-helix transcriptional regulator [Candidatus Dormibacteraeota bacterium]|nr:helix-turn-helix transcriptional regulator [Candidatus Dormibacteraeota bacterium]
MLLSSAMDAGSLSILSRATGQLGIDCEAAITPAEDAGLVTVTDAVRFRHPLIRSTVYAGASPKDRRQAHRVIASVLPVAATAERAMHRAAATIGPDDAIANDLEAIGQQEQARGGYQSASAIFGRAAALSSRTEDEVRRLTSAAMTAQLGGRSARAVECLDRALALTEEPLTHADLTLLRHTISQWLEHPIAAYEALTREASVIKSRDIGRAARLLTNAVYPCCMAAELVKAVETATQARELAQASGDHLLITGAIAVESIAHLLHGDGFRNAEPLKAALSAFLDPDLGTTIPVEVWNGAYAMFVAEDYRIARKLLTKAIQQNRAAGALVTLPYPLALLSEIEFRTGAWLEAYADASESVLLALETAQDSSRAYGLVCLARVEAATARDNVCAGHLAEALELAERFGTGSIPTYVWSIEGFKAVTNQQWQAAITALDALRRRCRQIEQREPNILRWQADLIEAYVRVGDVERAAAVINELTADVERTRGRWGYAAVARSRALLAMNEGEATSLFSQAIDLEADDPFEEARTHLLLGEWLRRAKRGVSAREHLHSALDAFERLGASTWATRTRRELMASGERIGRRRGPAVEALSPAELQVCRAVASGETNKEVAANLFISLKTVETHLTNAYAKLGLRSRSELARLFALEPERAVMPVA